MAEVQWLVATLTSNLIRVEKISQWENDLFYETFHKLEIFQNSYHFHQPMETCYDNISLHTTKLA